MSAFHEEVFHEIDSARKLVAEFKRLPYGNSNAAQAPGSCDDAELNTPGQKQAESVVLEKERAEILAEAADQDDTHLEAAEVLRELAEARAREWAAAEESIRKAREKRETASVASETTPVDPVRYTWFPGLGAGHVWYFTAGRERCGPVTFKDLRTMAASRVLDPRLDMVWKKGTPEWKQAGLVDGLFERNFIHEEVAATPVPRTAPVKSLRSSALLEKLRSKNLHWPGLGRRVVVPGVLLFPVLWNQLLSLVSPFLGSQLGMPLMGIIHPLLAILPPLLLAFLILNRLTNVGMNRWWSLAIMIPLLNLWIAFRCLFCPAGYAYHRKLDKAGLIMITSFVLIIPFMWQALLNHPVVTYGAYLQTGIRAVVDRAEKIVLPLL